MDAKTNFHTHSTWCDGRNTVEELVAGAEAKGFAALGFSSHAMLPADPLDWPLTAPRLAAYADAGVTYLRDGGDAFGVCARAKALAISQYLCGR